MRNDKLLQHNVNKTFDEILDMTDDEFRQWVIDLRKTIVDLWDNEELPPRVGFTENEAVKQFEKMVSFPVHQFAIKDELTGNKDVIRNTSVIGNAVNDWFPSMMKTRISYSTKGNAKSIYDYFADDKLLDTFVTYARRHFKRDSFYHYSAPVSTGDVLELGTTPYRVTTFEEFEEWFKENIEGKYPYGWFLCPVKEGKVYTGYNVELGKKKNLLVSNPEGLFCVRLFEKGQKLFPIGLKAFRVSFCQYAVQFPPLTARYIYETYTKHIANQDQINIYDPSAGWGGRLIGAMSVSDSRNIHYIGTDPNTDHNTTPGRTKYHEVADFFNDHVRIRNKLFPKAHTYEIFQKGSEVIGNDREFQKYKGKLDLVFTSPPYFAKEVYSDDPEQSCHKFNQYDAWIDGFLRPTLSTCVEYLRRDRYLLWNVADVAFDGKLLPLEEDSCRILKELGMEYVTTLKMSLAQMPGGNRMQATGDTETVTTNTVFGEETEENTIVKGMMKNYCQINSKGKLMYLKYEPILIFRKP